jgi:hypothetical protein
MPTQLPDVFFGPPTGKPTNWRMMADDNAPDDDELLPVTPPDVVELLGFDPLKEVVP